LDNENIDAHWLKIQGGGELKFLPKSLGVGVGGKAFRKNQQWGPLFRVLLHFYKQVFLKFAWMGYFVYTSFPPSPPPLPECIYEQECFQFKNKVTYWSNTNLLVGWKLWTSSSLIRRDFLRFGFFTIPTRPVWGIGVGPWKCPNGVVVVVVREVVVVVDVAVVVDVDAVVGVSEGRGVT
jgi:hypothetical protein